MILEVSHLSNMHRTMFIALCCLLSIVTSSSSSSNALEDGFFENLQKIHGDTYKTLADGRLYGLPNNLQRPIYHCSGSTAKALLSLSSSDCACMFDGDAISEPRSIGLIGSMISHLKGALVDLFKDLSVGSEECFLHVKRIDSVIDAIRHNSQFGEILELDLVEIKVAINDAMLDLKNQLTDENDPMKNRLIDGNHNFQAISHAFVSRLVMGYYGRNAHGHMANPLPTVYLRGLLEESRMELNLFDGNFEAAILRIFETYTQFAYYRNLLPLIHALSGPSYGILDLSDLGFGGKPEEVSSRASDSRRFGDFYVLAMSSLSNFTKFIHFLSRSRNVSINLVLDEMIQAGYNQTILDYLGDSAFLRHCFPHLQPASMNNLFHGIPNPTVLVPEIAQEYLPSDREFEVADRGIMTSSHYMSVILVIFLVEKSGQAEHIPNFPTVIGTMRQMRGNVSKSTLDSFYQTLRTAREGIAGTLMREFMIELAHGFAPL